MAKQKLEDKKEDLLILRWEFLRRNEEYVEDYKKYDKGVEKACKKYGQYDEEVDQYFNNQYEYFLKKYTLPYPINPKISLLDDNCDFKKDDIQKPSIDKIKAGREPLAEFFAQHKIEFQRKYIAQAMNMQYKAAFCLSADKNITSWGPDGIDIEPLTDEQLKSQQTIEVLIDLEASSAKIVQEIKEIIAKWQSLRKKVATTKIKKPRENELRRYIKVWDLARKSKIGSTYKQIAEVLKGKGFYKKQTLRKAEQLARKDFISACKLIGHKTKLPKSCLKPIIKIRGDKKNKDIFKQYEQELARSGMGLNETINRRTGQINLRHYDGATKKKILQNFKSRGVRKYLPKPD